MAQNKQERAMNPTALLLKEEGNRRFQAGDYLGAEGSYSKAIIADSLSPTLYTNRAMARLKLQQWDSVISDCLECLKLAPKNMKAHYYCGMAQLELGNLDEAHDHSKLAHALASATNDRSLHQVLTLLMRCKTLRWEQKEKRRVRQDADLEAELRAMLEGERDLAMRAAEKDGGSEAAAVEVRAEYDAKIDRLEKVFERSRAAADRKRVVPEWAIDEISFGVMVDPVVTKSGKSYERDTILTHLKTNKTDPITREPLHPSDLRPNLALKEACEAFLNENEWAADW
ncbi:hypothetical protein PpBr36_01455 [Pyricularia pennisetigena]|uniref:hypothetical protein n=1 Tax=Pyricularia pennisetigena TaxID=1578925 RepID=UPI0011529B34|nr:hypothetical protein PpBr36_01455 [Pyricularia pennisetigena]TLS29705.1 hypothetical protein PpBr36_01455 [Pyricularia pennisetigena]